MQYVLVHWIDSNETSILSDEFVKDKSMMNDSSKRGMVMFGDTKKKPPKSGWKSYLARVLAVSVSKKELMKKELAFIHTEEVDSQDKEFKDGLDDSDESDEPEQIKTIQNSKTAKRKAEHEAYRQVFKRIAPNESDESDDEGSGHSRKPSEASLDEHEQPSLNKLAAEIGKLRSEVARIHQRLPGLVTQAVQAALAETKASKVHQPRPFQKLKDSVSPPSPQLVRPCSSANSSSSQDKVDNGAEAETSDSPKLSDYIDSVQMGEVMRSPNFKKMTVNLMTALFERKVLAESSVIGKSKEGRPALDRNKIQLIIACVIKRFPEANDSTIKSTMAQKCKDFRLSMENKKKKIAEGDK